MRLPAPSLVYLALQLDLVKGQGLLQRELKLKMNLILPRVLSLASFPPSFLSDSDGLTESGTKGTGTENGKIEGLPRGLDSKKRATSCIRLEISLKPFSD